jgi:hypothetical protein
MRPRCTKCKSFWIISGAKPHRSSPRVKKALGDKFFKQIQWLEHRAAAEKTPFREPCRQSLDFVIDAVIKKFITT